MEDLVQEGETAKTTAGGLTLQKFETLFHAGRLPSGNEFELMEDTVEMGLKVSEVGERLPWKKKAEQAGVICKSVGPIDVQDIKTKDRTQILGGLLDTDLVFISMAWTAQNADMSIKIDKSSDLRCPQCNAKIHNIPFGGVSVHARPAPLDGPNTMWPVELEGKLPSSLQGGRFVVVDPTWQTARSKVGEAQWGDPETVMMNRVFAALRFVREGEAIPRVLSRTAEFYKLRPKAAQSVAEQMSEFIPYFDKTFLFVCEACGEEVDIPFDLGL